VTCGVRRGDLLVPYGVGFGRAAFERLRLGQTFAARMDPSRSDQCNSIASGSPSVSSGVAGNREVRIPFPTCKSMPRIHR
jgi:hypothetical protein